MKIVLSGGGTLGPVVPLLAIRTMYLQHDPNAEFLWVGSKSGPEKAVVVKAGVRYKAITCGKFRRYISFLNLADIARVKIGFFQSLLLLRREKPDLLISTGGFVSVPLHWAAAVLRIPMWVHQQDRHAGLANRLMFPFAQKITTALEVTSKDLKKKHAEWIGNPVRDLACNDKATARKRFGIPSKASVVFVLGGGTGSEAVNQHIVDVLSMLPSDCHVIHLAGFGKQNKGVQEAMKQFKNYHSFLFFGEEDMKQAYGIADVVVARAGFSTLTELASLGKAAIIIPIPESHQEENAKALADIGAVQIFEQRQPSEDLATRIIGLLSAKEMQDEQVTKLNEVIPTANKDAIIKLVDSFKK